MVRYLIIFLVHCIAFQSTIRSAYDLYDNSTFKILESHYDHDKIMIYKFLDTQKNTYIVFLKDAEGNHYIVKQEKTSTISRQFRSLSEVLCAHIAQTASIPSHAVTLLPLGVPFPGKFIAKRVATLHTLVPGKTLRSMGESIYAKIDIKQSTNPDLPFERKGFNERTIFFMSQHPDLPKIVALDTFTGNKDRNKANILYDHDSDSFYAIDMALMYDTLAKRTSIIELACEQVLHMIKQKKEFSQKELDALLEYRSTLQQLVREFPPRVMGNLLDKLLEESGLLSDLSPFSADDLYELIRAYKRTIKESYMGVKRLIYLLFLLINN